MESRQRTFIVNGLDCDEQSRCRHWHSEEDIVAIQFFCCRDWYACYECHAVLADHPAKPWPSTHLEKTVILCGSCKTQLSIFVYKSLYQQNVPRCPQCHARFNPGCSLHFDAYFDSASP